MDSATVQPTSRILLVEDDLNINRLLEFAIKSAGGFQVHSVTTAEAALELLESPVGHRIDLVILDVALPDLSGLDVLRRIRGNSGLASMGVIVLSALGEESDRIAGFEAGTDDYLCKPFLPSELLARIRAVLRRTGRKVEADAPLEKRIGEFALLENDHRVVFRGNEIHLTHTEYQIVSVLINNVNQVRSRESLLQEVWGAIPEEGTRVVDSHVKRLRGKLGGAGDYIHTIYGVGYRFEVPRVTRDRKSERQ
jgi:two-component system phosphate regulon response regulator PhoB